jgi:biopolymer transport protein ExbD
MIKRRVINTNVKQVETDLIPIMNLFTALVPFLLVSAAFYKMSVIDVSIPSVGEQAKAKLEKEEPYLSLTFLEKEISLEVIGVELNASENDFFKRNISGFSGGALTKDTLDRLEEYVLLVKAHFEASEMVVLRVADAVPYKHVVVLMDLLRGQSFNQGAQKRRFSNIVIAESL